MPGRIAERTRALHAIFIAALLATGCQPSAAFPVTVTFVGPVELEVGADVRYQGVRVGEVEKVSLRQPSPREPARVELALLIEDPKITLREADVFEIVSDGLLGDSYVRVTAAAETSEPLSPGATVAGRSPFVSRVLESTSNALDALADLAKQSRDAMLDALARAAEAEAEEEQALP